MRYSYLAFRSSSLREHCPRSLDSVQSPVPKIKLSEEPGLTVGVGWGIKINHVHPISCLPDLSAWLCPSYGTFVFEVTFGQHLRHDTQTDLRI